jgi:predicted nucleotidyltransferase
MSKDNEPSLRVREVTPAIIDVIRQRIVDAVHPQQIVLFGSQARRDAGSGSDVDLLVVHDTPRTDREVRRHLDRLFLDRRFGLDLIVRTPQEVAENVADGNPFYTEHIFGEGIILYEREGSEETG